MGSGQRPVLAGEGPMVPSLRVACPALCARYRSYELRELKSFRLHTELPMWVLTKNQRPPEARQTCSGRV
eukprot:4781504-Prymnesium_polylepis.1